MFYSEDDILFYEEEIDLTRKLEREFKERQEQAFLEAQAIEEQRRREEDETHREKKRARGKLLQRIAAGTAAALMISVGSIAVYDRAVVQPAMERLALGAGPVEQEIIFRPVSYGNELTVPEIIEKAKPSVVAISVNVNNGWYGSSGTGSGVIMSADGKILTNQHVVIGASEIKVRLYDGKEYPATLIAEDEKTDLAVIQIEATGLVPAEFGDSDALVQGEIAVAIGNPLNLSLEGSVTQGIISAVSREIVLNNKSMTYIQTDAAINPGNSGGALVNGKGQVIGINSAKVASSDVEGLGFAIPVNIALPVVEELIEHGYVKGRPSIGISVQNITRQIASYYRLPQGVQVILVTPDSAADKAGITSGDIIIGINGIVVTTSDELNNEKDKFNPGDTITLTVYRGGETADIALVLGETMAE